MEREGDTEDIFFRKVLFSVLVVMVSCMGVWFLLTSLTGSEDNQPVLSATGPAPVGAHFYTVRLLEFDPAQRGTAARVAASSSVEALARGHEFRFLELLGGRMALCVGRFDTQDSPAMQELLNRFREYNERGRRPFSSAAVQTFSE